MKINTISFNTLGCRLNQSETSSIMNSFKDNGFQVVGFDEPADIVVINTCTVTENGDADTRRLVNKACRTNPQTRIALIGCQAQVQKDELSKMPNVRWVIGNERKMEFLSILQNSRDEQKTEVITPTISRSSFTIPYLSIDHHRTRANLKIQDGCDFFCSFCEIPYARGRARMREFDDIIKEAKALVSAKHKELVITGINVGTYDYQGKTIVDVIEKLEKVDGLERIRISSIEPTTIDERLITKMKEGGKLCRYLHIPLQSGSDLVLKSMNRKYTVKEFSQFIRHVYDQIPGICIGTDVIVGFPTETEESFEETFEVLKQNPIHYFHVFSYSKRKFAKSNQSRKEVDKSIIQRRSRLLRDLSTEKKSAYYKQLVGSEQPILFEQNKGEYFTGLSANYCRVFVRTEQNLENQIKKVSIRKLEGGKLIGVLV